MNKPFGASNKDNLTDVIQALPQNAPTPVSSQSNSSTNTSGNNSGSNATSSQQRPVQQVVATNGEIVTLGHNSFKK